MKEFSWEEYRDVNKKIAVHCKTEEEAKDFYKQLDEHGMYWADGDNYIKQLCYEVYKSQTCYSGPGMYCNYDYYKMRGFTILEWSDYMKFTKADLKNGMVVEYRNLLRRVVIGNSLIGENGYNDLDNYDDMLLSLGYSDNDIIKVYEIKEPDAFSAMMKTRNLRLIWDRFNIQRMTTEEMRQKLEELTGSTIEIIEN